MSIGKTIGGVADKMLKLTEKAVKSLEDYGKQSAVENNNENARKLAETMKKLGNKLEKEHDNYIQNVEKNAEEIAQQGKAVLGKLKYACKEMKTRADAAREKAEKDAAKNVQKDGKTDSQSISEGDAEE